MKLLTLRRNGAFRPGILLGDMVLDLVAAREAVPLSAMLAPTLRGLFAGGPEVLLLLSRIVELSHGAGARDRLEADGALLPFADASLAPVIPDGDLLLSGSMNSRGHLAEMGDDLPEWPCAFLKVRSALNGSGADIVAPPGHGDMIDWEGEFCVVIGTRCHQVSEAAALEHVVGYTLLNDVSAREYALPFIKSTKPSPTAQAWERNVLGKNYPTFAPLGPVIATKDELSDPLHYQMDTLVNGQVMQTSTPEDLVFSPAQMIAYFSQYYILQPGDIISMGSPPGVGMARKPPQFLKPGDTVEVRVKEIGSLVNRVAAAKAA
jgi:acylpyruvate hydrolase